MLLDTDDIIKRISIVVGCIIITTSIGAVVWYNSNLKNEFVEGKTETNYLRQETSRLGAETDNLKNDVIQRDRELKTTILLNIDETKKVDNELQQQNSNLKQFQLDSDRVRNEIKTEIAKLRDANNLLADAVIKLRDANISLAESLKTKELDLKSEDTKLKTEQDKIKSDLKTETAKLQDLIKNKDQEIEDLKNRLNKEIEWRNKFTWNR